MHTYDQSLVGAYHVDRLRCLARRDADARAVAPRSHLRTLLRSALGAHHSA